MGAAWLKRFGLHLAAAVGATGIFVGAAVVGAHQTRLQADATPPPIASVVRPRTQTPGARPKPQVVVTPTPEAPGSQAQATPGTAPAAAQPTTVGRERSLAGTIKAVDGDVLDVVGVGGREWHVDPAPGALIRLNGKAAKLDALQPGDGVLILGQAQSGPGLRFLAHAITARAK